jgi:F420-dependent oxidoreductase-like protein
MKIGLQLYNYNWQGAPENVGSTLVDVAKTAERVGFSSLWAMDHFFQLDRGFGPPEITKYDEPVLESYTTLTYLGGVTKKMKLGAMVTGNIYRHPGILIKMVTALDVLTGGRAYLGIGTGWYRREAEGLGVPFPETRCELFGRLEETLQIARHMWSGDRSPFKGKYYYLKEPINRPQPVYKPHPPILIGGDGEKTTLRLTAKYADASNMHVGGPVEWVPSGIKTWWEKRVERINRKIAKLKGFCKEFGRSLEEIELTVLATIELAEGKMKSSQLVELCGEMSALGIHHLIFNMPNAHTLRPIEIIGHDVIPYARSL